MAGLLAHVDSDNARFPLEEIRFGVILNGGASLAVWMGGTVVELDRLTKAGHRATPVTEQRGAAKVYAALLALAGSTARADVITGTSAGGINGAALALAQVNPDAPLGMLRDIWVDQGRIESLMRQPFRGAPTSLLQGDEFFLPQLNNALSMLAKPSDTWREPALAPIDLSITTTVLNGNQRLTVDSMGQWLPQTIHGARFHWQRLPTTSSAGDPFSAAAIERTTHRLALASRSTASFPIAFEPSFVPVRSPLHAEPAAGSALSDQQRLRPDMAGVVADWSDDNQSRNRSRFAVDGGLLANTPTRPALEAVEAMPASGPVRRVMLLVFPHAKAPGPDQADEQDTPPTLAATVGGMMSALTAQGNRTFVDELDEHNKRAAGRRGTRGDVLRSVGESGDNPSDELESLGASLYPHYRRLRRWRAARDLARRAVERPLVEGGPATALPDGWNYERVRRAAENAQDEWQRTWGRPSPYYPDRMPRLGDPEPVVGWRWGVTTGLGVAEAGADLLRRLIWVTTGDDYDLVLAARTTISTTMAKLREARRDTDEIWSTPELASLQPNESYWSLRLASYEYLMGEPTDTTRLTHAIGRVAHTEAVVRGGADPEVVAELETELTATLTRLLVPEPERSAEAGEQVRRYAAGVVTALQPVLPVLMRHCAAHDAAASAREDTDLHHWRDVLAPGGRVLTDAELLTRLLQIEIAATTLGDEVSTGATLPVEVAQLSAQTANAFVQYSRSADDKLGGMSVQRFSGFLKRSWRVNDWTWGRVDAASYLCRIVLQPARVRRAAELSGYLSAETSTATAAAQATVAEIMEQLFPEELLGDPRIRDLERRAVGELTPVLDSTKPTEDLDAAMPALADLFAWALHLDIVPSELPALAGAVRADGVEGANARSYGEVFVKEHELLLTRLDRHIRGESPELSPQDRIAALAAFDRAGIGREPLNQEGASDQMIRTATTAAAVAATVADSEQSGLTAAKPVTRALRGVMLLPFWVVTGLTGKGMLARSFSVLALAIGAVFLSLALLGALPAGMSGPAAAVGASAVLAAFAIGALRSGTMLHGLVLLTPIVPLIVFAVDLARTEDGQEAAAAARGVSTLLIVIALAIALMVLGSLPATTGSVFAALDRLADGQHIPRIENASGTTRGFLQAGRRILGLLMTAAGLAFQVGLIIAVVALVTWIARTGWESIAARASSINGWLIAAAALALVLIGGGIAWTQGRQLQVLRRQRADLEKWEYQPVAHPAGASAGWAVLYGAGYLVLAAVLSTRDSWLDLIWVRALIAISVVLGVLLILVVPLWVPIRALLRITDREVARALSMPPPQPAPADGDDPAAATTAARAATASDLVARGVAYRAFVSATDGEPPTLARPLGVRLHNRIRTKRERLQ